MTREEIFAGVCGCLTAALDVPAGSIRRDSKIVDDLGADSLDLLDLTFQLEQRFKVAISPRDIERRTREKLGGAALEVDGTYTPEALAEFREAMPEIPPEELSKGLTVAELPRRLRVGTMANLVARLLEEKNG